jgi:hypothetical protein
LGAISAQSDEFEIGGGDDLSGVHPDNPPHDFVV